MISLHYTFKAHMKKKESRQSGPTFPGMGRYRRSRGIGCTISQGTYEADCQNVPGANVSIHKMRAPRKSLPEVRAVSEADGGAVLSYKSKMSQKVNSSPGSWPEGPEGAEEWDRRPEAA